MIQLPAGALPNIVARPEAFVTTYAALASGGTTSTAYVQGELGAAFSALADPGCITTFASVVAFNAAASGASSLDPFSATLKQLLTTPTLAAQHYCKLTALLSLLANPWLVPPDLNTAGTAKPTIHFLTWLPTVPLNTGAHCQLVVFDVLTSAYLLLDPTYAYALSIPYVGSGPQNSLSVVQNAAAFLQTPNTTQNLAILDPAGTAAVPQMLTTLLSGALGPQYLDSSSTDGPSAWDSLIGQTFENWG
jgi:hypothetical protein